MTDSDYETRLAEQQKHHAAEIERWRASGDPEQILFAELIEDVVLPCVEVMNRPRRISAKAIVSASSNAIGQIMIAIATHLVIEGGMPKHLVAAYFVGEVQRRFTARLSAMDFSNPDHVLVEGDNGKALAEALKGGAA